MNHHLRAQTLHSSIKITVPSSSFIQTILSAPESHRIMPLGPRALPPVGNRTLPEGFRFFYHNTLYIICKAKVWKSQPPFHIDFICQFCYSIRIDYCHLRIRRI